MEDKLQFQKKLAELLRTAKEHDRRIGQDSIVNFFQEEQLSEEQLNMIKEYLLSQGVDVMGYSSQTAQQPSEARTLSPEEEAYLKKYQEELRLIPEEAPGERERLIQKVIEGDTLSKGRLTELYLPCVAEIARELSHPEVFLGDAVSEGNVNLLLAMENLDTPEGADAFIRGEIRRGILAFIEEQTDQKIRDDSMVHKVKRLEAAIKELSEDMDKKFSIEELSFYLDMTEEEIRDILSLTGEDK